MLIDIEALGRNEFDAGVTHALSKLLDNPARRGTYNHRGHPIRHKIGRRVEYLKRLPEDKYRRLLARKNKALTKQGKRFPLI